MKKGSFTGAKKGGKPGKFQLANGGTLVLDEIGDMPLSLQAKILRVIQEKVVEPVGSVRPQPVDVRIIAATHRDIELLIAKEKLREDLFYRLNCKLRSGFFLTVLHSRGALSVADNAPLHFPQYFRSLQIIGSEPTKSYNILHNQQIIFN